MIWGLQAGDHQVLRGGQGGKNCLTNVQDGSDLAAVQPRRAQHVRLGTAGRQYLLSERFLAALEKVSLVPRSPQRWTKCGACVYLDEEHTDWQDMMA